MDISASMRNKRPMDTVLLSVTDLTCARGGLPVLSGVSFSVKVGEALVLKGPNGSGKTTLLRTISGLQPADKGQITCEPDSIAYAGHADGIKATLTVAENLKFWAAIFGTDDIDHALTAYDLAALRNRAAQTLSAGQKRRLGLARLLVTARPVWLLDEPTVSLDQSSVALFANVVRDHLTAGGAAVLSSHLDLGFNARTLEIADFRNRQAAEEEVWL